MDRNIMPTRRRRRGRRRRRTTTTVCLRGSLTLPESSSTRKHRRRIDRPNQYSSTRMIKTFLWVSCFIGSKHMNSCWADGDDQAYTFEKETTTAQNNFLRSNNPYTTTTRPRPSQQNNVAKVDLSCDALSDFCFSPNNGFCDSEIGYNVPGCERGDCVDCQIYCGQYDYDCTGCINSGCYWCPGDAKCYNTDLYIFTNENSTSCSNQLDYVHRDSLPTNNIFNNNHDNICTESGNFFSDPLYSSSKWVFDMIDLVPVWQKGYFGAGVRVRINDDTVAINHEEFADRFDLDASCDSDKYMPREPEDSYYDGHGTSVASILAASANNGLCSVGISPGITFSVCHAFGGGSKAEFLSEKLEQVDISSNSYGSPACWPVEIESPIFSARRDRRSLLRSSPWTISTKAKNTTCPFTNFNVFTRNPCEMCNFAAPLTPHCERSIIRHCQQFYNEDSLACVEFLDLLVDGGECEYNTLSEGQLSALSKGVTQGRNGKGIIFVVASGNDMIAGGDTNFEGFSNTRLTISVGAVGKDGLHASYSNPGASLFVSAPGGDHEFVSNHITAFVGGGCNDAGVGTSFSCPVVSGVIALMLEANPNLRWRDVQGILALTSRIPSDPNDGSLVTNSAGYQHSNFYGFGIVNANDAVLAAESWELFPLETMLAQDTGILNIPIFDRQSAWAISSATITDTNTEYDDGFFSESVVILLDIRHFSRGDLAITLTSPSGTSSVLHPGKRPETTQLDVDDRWKLMTLRNWGESPFGTWSLNVTDVSKGDVSECVDHLWDLQTPGRTVDCSFFERRKYCADGKVDVGNITADGNSALFSLTDEDQDLTFEEACCECGGGRRRGDGNAADMVVQWRIVVYGHGVGMSSSFPPSDAPTSNPSFMPSSTVPSGIPSFVPSDAPSIIPSGVPSDHPSESQYPSQIPSYSHHPSLSSTPSTSSYPSEFPSQSRYPSASLYPSTSMYPTESLYPTNTASNHPTQSQHPSTSPDPGSIDHPTHVASSSPSASEANFLPTATHSSTESHTVPSQTPSAKPSNTLPLTPEITKQVTLSPILLGNNYQTNSAKDTQDTPTAVPEQLASSEEPTANPSSGVQADGIQYLSISVLVASFLTIWPML